MEEPTRSPVWGSHAADATPLGDTGLVTEPEPTPVFRRFPWVQLVFCIACLSMAAWTWMRYSWAWSVDATRLRKDLAADRRLWEGRYVRLRGKALSSAPLGRADKMAACTAMRGHSGDSAGGSVVVLSPWTGPDLPVSGEVLVVAGRVLGPEQAYRVLADLMPGFMGLSVGCPVVLAEASRFHGASVAGLIVGAMGVFIFSVALRHWLGERRAFREEARA